MKQILFVCTGNTCRSSMAEALLKKMLSEEKIEDIEVKSVGVFAVEGQPATMEAMEVLRRDGIDISLHRSTLVNKEFLKESDLILTMAKGHKDVLIRIEPFVQGKVFTLKEYAFGIEEDIADPYGKGLKAYEEAKNDIEEALKEVLKRIQK